ncbi:hypothetical protein ACISK3_06375 [Morganella morganii]|nr:hypothetical protein [Morganella morganii]
MKKLTVTCSVLPLALFSAVFALPSYAAETDCKPMSEQTRLNHMRMMGLSYLNGPVKSSSMVTDGDQPDSAAQIFSAGNVTLSPCGQITHYDFTRRSTQYGMIFDLQVAGAETADEISMAYRFSADYTGKKKTRPTISRIFLLKDAQQVITGYRTENFIEGNSTIMTENGTVEYRDNNIHSVLINSEILAKSYSLNFDYDNAGRVTRIYTTPIPLSDFNFTYNEEGGPDKGTERTESTGIVTGNDIQCTEWDMYQNCTAGVWLRHINGEPAGEVPFHTTYEYYGDK